MPRLVAECQIKLCSLPLQTQTQNTNPKCHSVVLCDQYHPDGRIFLHLVKLLQALEWIIFRLVMGRSAAASYRVSKVHKLFLPFSDAEGGRKLGRDRQAKSTNFSPPEATVPWDFSCLLLFSFSPHWTSKIPRGCITTYGLLADSEVTDLDKLASLFGRLAGIQLLIPFELTLANLNLTM